MLHISQFSFTLLILVSLQAFAAPQVATPSSTKNHPFNPDLGLTNEEKNYLEQKKFIRMCVDPSWLPIERINDSGQHEGIAADYIKLLQSRMGITIELYPTKNWKNAVKAAKNRDCDIFSAMAVTPSRQEYMLYPPPILN